MIVYLHKNASYMYVLGSYSIWRSVHENGLMLTSVSLLEDRNCSVDGELLHRHPVR